MTDDETVDATTARQALDDVARARTAVRDTPWPVWLYPVNAVLLGLMALTPLAGDRDSVLLLVGAAAVIAVNVVAGHLNGAPWALPTSRGFLTGVAVAAGCLAASAVASSLTDRTWPFVVLAVLATASYLAGSVAHRASTRR